MKLPLLLLPILFACSYAAALPMTESVGQKKEVKISAAEEKYQQGARLYEKNDLVGAQRLFEEVVDEDASHVEARLALGEILFQRNDFDAASKVVAEALNLDGKNVSALISYGKVLFLKRDFMAAEKSFLGAIALNPASFDARINLADLYMSSQPEKIDVVLEAYESALMVNPEHPGALFAKGRLLLAKQDIDGAILFLGRASKDPVNPNPEKWLGDAWVIKGESKKAEHYYQAALKKDERFAPAWVALANLYDQTHQTEQSWKTLLEAVRRNPMDAFLWYQQGVFAQKNNKVSDAIKAYEQAIKLNPQHALALNNLAWLLFEQEGDLQRALKLAREALDIEPTNSAFQDTLKQIESRFN